MLKSLRSLRFIAVRAPRKLPASPCGAASTMSNVRSELSTSETAFSFARGQRLPRHEEDRTHDGVTHRRSSGRAARGSAEVRGPAPSSPPVVTAKARRSILVRAPLSALRHQRTRSPSRAPQRTAIRPAPAQQAVEGGTIRLTYDGGDVWSPIVYRRFPSP